MSRSRAACALIALLCLAPACGGGAQGATARITLVAYSTPQEAYGEIEAAFKDTPQGAGVGFTESYGGSGDQSRAVEAGQPADVVAFSLEPDMARLVEAGIVARDWDAGPDAGIVTRSVTVFVVRKGNPKHIVRWADLVQPGVEVVTPNPFTSGGARWNVLAAFGAQLVQGRSEVEATRYLTDLFDNVVVQDDSARKALQTFSGGKGDVLLAYENEAIFAQQAGEPIEYVVPDQTILIENPVAVTTGAGDPTAARAFVSFLRSPTAQAIFVKHGYRPVIDGVPGAEAFAAPPDLFDITLFGGWSEANLRFFDPHGSIMKDVEEGIGVAVG